MKELNRDLQCITGGCCSGEYGVSCHQSCSITGYQPTNTTAHDWVDPVQLLIDFINASLINLGVSPCSRSLVD